MNSGLSFRMKQWWSYYQRAKTIHQADSPFLYRFCREVLESDAKDPWFEKIENLRGDLLKNNELFVHTDFGAGSGKPGKKQSMHRLSDFIRRSAIRPESGRLLHRISRFFEANHILELGTAAGLSTAYLSKPGGKGQLITVEGDSYLASVAKATFDKLGLQPDLLIGAFDQVLPGILGHHPVFDLIFIDGNHRGAALESYIRLLSPYLHPDLGVIILDDIHWSRDMAGAWDRLRLERQWNLSLDLFQFGLLIRNRDLLHFNTLDLIARKWKPLNPGIFR
ncbi:MAG TPA: class I SAM-dependent methyltransferase [Saprospiraceae bacterium]|nr:class I SAM-dependent methyltransferase [Saprospiraceae bacterium]HNT20037.1 class I SAM-dependent methyltransferase [Saprospiraceae bacterium]